MTETTKNILRLILLLACVAGAVGLLVYFLAPFQRIFG